MQYTRLGKTNLMVSRTAFGAIPIQRISSEDASALLQHAFAQGINFYDTARGYTDSEIKIGQALGSVRDKIMIATKNSFKTPQGLTDAIDQSLSELGTDYVDLFQFHNPDFMPVPGGADGLYDAALKAKADGKIKHIGITNHRLALAKEMVKSGHFETMQFPMSHLATDEELELVALCEAHDVGFIAMKALAGGIITNAQAAFAFLRQYENIVPIWGIQFMHQLDEILGYEMNPPKLDDALKAIIQADRDELMGGFCRACGYCLPCPAEIDIPQAARMRLLLGRTSLKSFMTEDYHKRMHRVDGCTHCGHCAAHCPYQLKLPELIFENLAFYDRFYDEYMNAH